MKAASEPETNDALCTALSRFVHSYTDFTRPKEFHALKLFNIMVGYFFEVPIMTILQWI